MGLSVSTAIQRGCSVDEVHSRLRRSGSESVHRKNRRRSGQYSIQLASVATDSDIRAKDIGQESTSTKSSILRPSVTSTSISWITTPTHSTAALVTFTPQCHITLIDWHPETGTQR